LTAAGASRARRISAGDFLREHVMRLLSSCEIERIGGGGAFCDIEVGLWGTGLGVMAGVGLGLVNPLLGITVGGVMAGTAMAFGPDTLCRDRETEYRFPYIN
jgi:hypothetical protein